MHFRFVAKAVGILLLSLVLLIPVAMIRDLIGERQARRQQAVQEIALGWGAQQAITGPYLAVPYKRTWVESISETVDGRQKERRTERTEAGLLRLPVDTVSWRVDATTSEKSRGIHKARLYAATVRGEGSITIPAGYGATDAEGRVEWHAPRLVIGVQDPRGIRTLSALEFGSGSVDFSPGTMDGAAGSGIHAVLATLREAQPRSYAFRFSMELAGAESFAMVPLANETALAMTADWPHPSFQGRFLPSSHRIRDTGFSAQWKVSRYASQGAERLRACSPTKACGSFNDQALLVSFVEPVGVYQLLDRTSKYGFLFVGFVFAAFYLFELLRRLAIHPVQYALVGAALAMFFLLITALSEHVAFAVAYAAGASACVGLIIFYVVRVLQSALLGLAFGSALAVLYGALYLLLNAEDYALLAGSLLVFALLAGVMAATRGVDWYALIGMLPRQEKPATP